MKILWISYFGSWTKPLMDRLSINNDIRLIVPSKVDEETIEGNIKIYNLKLSESETTNSMTPSVYKKYDRIINSFSPDIIHVHGTEKNLAQVQNYIKDIPVVISIQGLNSGYIPFDCCYLTQEIISPFRTLKNRLGRGGLQEMHRKFVKGKEEYEKDILENGKYFFCRTNWDNAWVSFSNPNALIYQGEELLRDSFYEQSGSWNYEKCNPHTIFMPSGFNPIKGLHIALKAVNLLKHFFPNVTLVVPGLPKHILDYNALNSKLFGEEFVNYCKDIIKRNELNKNVILLPRLDASGMANEMMKANVFLSPSSIDNSPNAVGEAMMIGVPIVSTAVGGVTSFLKDNDNCLLASSGDEYLIAYQIKRIFEDLELAKKLSFNAHETALHRHNPQMTVQQYNDAYKNIIEIHNQRLKGQ